MDGSCFRVFLSCFVAHMLSADSSCIAAVSASVVVSLLCAVVLSRLGSVLLTRARACVRVYIYIYIYIYHIVFAGEGGLYPTSAPRTH